MTKKEKSNSNRFMVDLLLQNGEKKQIFLDSWSDHVLKRDEIIQFSTIVKDQLYHFSPSKGQILLPFSEYHGDHDQCWILCLDVNTGEEIYRKNARTTDLVEWKLSPSLTNTETNGK